MLAQALEVDVLEVRRDLHRERHALAMAVLEPLALVAQTGEQVAAMRRLIESGAPLSASAPAAAVSPPAETAAPASMADQLAALGVK
jgi:hypothetical protein